jgi:hypothetical protein
MEGGKEESPVKSMYLFDEKTKLGFERVRMLVDGENDEPQKIHCKIKLIFCKKNLS